MTHQNDCAFADEIAQKGLNAIPELIRALINNAMQVERPKYLQAEQYERTAILAPLNRVFGQPGLI